jgi:carboxylesterase
MLGDDASQPSTFRVPTRAFAEFNSLGAVVRRELCEIDVPTLILHPRHDELAGLGNALEIQRKLRGPVETLVLNDSHQLITRDVRRDMVVNRSLEFARCVTLRADLWNVRQPRRSQGSALEPGVPSH